MKNESNSILKNKIFWDSTWNYVSTTFGILGGIGSVLFLKDKYNDYVFKNIQVSYETKELADKIKDTLIEKEPDMKYFDSTEMAKRIEQGKLDARTTRKVLRNLKK